MRNVAAALAIGCIAAGASVLALDTTLRFLGVQPVNLRPALHQPSDIPGLEYELRPNLHAHGFRSETVTTDAHGFRSDPIVDGKPVIAILGDSYAFGFGVRDAETNPATIARALSGYNVVNTGVNGYNIEQEVHTYEMKVRRLRPVITVLEFTPNDGDRKAYFNLDIRERVSGTGWTIRGPRWWIRTSPFVDIVRRGIRRMQEPLPTHTPVIVEWSEPELAMYTTWFGRLNEGIGDERKLVVLWPDRAQRPDTFRRIREMAEKHGWNVLDLTALLGNDFDRLGWDSHPSALTQRIAGEAIVKEIRALLNLPQR